MEVSDLLQFGKRGCFAFSAVGRYRMSVVRLALISLSAVSVQLPMQTAAHSGADSQQSTLEKSAKVPELLLRRSMNADGPGGRVVSLTMYDVDLTQLPMSAFGDLVKGAGADAN